MQVRSVCYVPPASPPPPFVLYLCPDEQVGQSQWPPREGAPPFESLLFFSAFLKLCYQNDTKYSTYSLIIDLHAGIKISTILSTIP